MPTSLPEPISAPPFRDSYDSMKGGVSDADEFSQTDKVEAANVIDKAVAHVPPHREVMTFANRYNYSHYYKLPAQVGLMNVPAMVQEMMREGCKLTDIQITFDVVEDR